MSDTRDQAIAAMIDGHSTAVGSVTNTEYYSHILDAIPPSVLAQLAIERGGLEDDGTWVDPDDLATHYEDEQRPDGAMTLYRLAKP